jgi:hypothetical protein
MDRYRIPPLYVLLVISWESLKARKAVLRTELMTCSGGIRPRSDPSGQGPVLRISAVDNAALRCCSHISLRTKSETTSPSAMCTGSDMCLCAGMQLSRSGGPVQADVI